MWLTGNQLSGNIPSSISNLTQLIELNLASNTLSGTIPVNIGNLNQLQYLQLENNQISGTIPNSIGSIASIVDIELGNNQISGAITNSLSNLSNLMYLDLSENQISGSIPASLGNLNNLTQLYLSNNLLSGTIPSSLGNLNNLQCLDISSNQIRGAVPSITNLIQLEVFSISYNQITSLPLLPASSSAGSYANVDNNNLSFSTIIPNLAYLRDYIPQNNVGTSNTIYGTIGKSFTINLGIDSSLSTNTYNWYKNGVYYNTTTVNNISIPKIAITDTGSYSCIITNSLVPNLTLYSNQVRLVIGTGPQITKQPATLTQCAGTKATFSVSASGTGLKYQWYFNGTIIPGATTASYSISNISSTNSGNYDVVVTDSNNKSVTSNNATLTVNSLPVAILSPLTPKVCSGSSQKMTATIENGTSPYISSWTGTGATALSSTNTSNPTFLDTTAGTFGLTYKVTDANTCGSSAVSTTITNIKIKASISSPTVFSFCSGIANRITAAVSGGTAPYTYSWTGTGSGYLSSQTAINPLFTGTTPGSYTLIFTATDANGCAGNITINITVNGTPTATISPLTPKVCAGSGQIMKATVTGGTSPYTSLWTGTGATGLNVTNTLTPTFTDTTAGSYVLTYKVTDANNCSSPAVSTTITNIKIKTGISSPTVFSFCKGIANRITASASGGTAPYTYSWTGTGSVYLDKPATINPQFTGTTTGNYSLTFTATDANGCAGSITINITVNGIPSATISPLTSKVCSGSSQIMTATIIGGTSPYTSLWTGTGSTALSATNITNPTFLDTTAGSYGLTYKVTDANNCSSSAVSTTITNIKVKASITSPAAFVFCEGTSTTITGAVSGGTAPYTYAWTGSGSGYLNKTTTINPKFTATTQGSYNLILTATDANGCKGSITIILTVPSTTAIATNSGPVCPGNPLTLSGMAAGMTSFAWTGPNGFSNDSQSPTVSTGAITAMAGTYTLVASNGSCTSTTTTIVTFNTLPTVAAFNSGPVCVGNELSVYGPPGLVSYSWTGPNNFSSSDTSQYTIVSTNATTASNGTYYLTASNGICNDTASTYVTVNSPPEVTTGNNGPVCTGNTLTLSGEAEGMTSYAWTGPNGFYSTIQNPTVSTSVTTAMAGIYTLAASNGICTSTATTTVTVNTSPSITAFNSGPVCAGNELSIQGTSGLVNYSWTGPNDFKFKGTNLNKIGWANAITALTGTYTLTASNGTCNDSASTYVTVNPLPTVTASNNGPVYVGSNLTLTGEPAGMTSYTWTGPERFTSSIQNPTVSTRADTAMAGIYKLTANNGNCSSSASTRVTVMHGFIEYSGEEPICYITYDGKKLNYPDTVYSLTYECPETTMTPELDLNNDDEIFSSTWKLSDVIGGENITIDESNGELTIKGAGSADVMAKVIYVHYDSSETTDTVGTACGCNCGTDQCVATDDCCDTDPDTGDCDNYTYYCTKQETIKTAIYDTTYASFELIVTAPVIDSVHISNLSEEDIGLNATSTLKATVYPTHASTRMYPGLQTMIM